MTLQCGARDCCRRPRPERDDARTRMKDAAMGRGSQVFSLYWAVMVNGVMKEYFS